MDPDHEENAWRLDIRRMKHHGDSDLRIPIIHYSVVCVSLANRSQTLSEFGCIYEFFLGQQTYDALPFLNDYWP